MAVSICQPVVDVLYWGVLDREQGQSSLALSRYRSHIEHLALCPCYYLHYVGRFLFFGRLINNHRFQRFNDLLDIVYLSLLLPQRSLLSRFGQNPRTVHWPPVSYSQSQSDATFHRQRPWIFPSSWRQGQLAEYIWRIIPGRLWDVGRRQYEWRSSKTQQKVKFPSIVNLPNANCSLKVYPKVPFGACRQQPLSMP